MSSLFYLVFEILPFNNINGSKYETSLIVKFQNFDTSKMFTTFCKLFW